MLVVYHCGEQKKGDRLKNALELHTPAPKRRCSKPKNRLDGDLGRLVEHFFKDLRTRFGRRLLEKVLNNFNVTVTVTRLVSTDNDVDSLDNSVGWDRHKRHPSTNPLFRFCK